MSMRKWNVCMYATYVLMNVTNILQIIHLSVVKWPTLSQNQIKWHWIVIVCLFVNSCALIISRWVLCSKSSEEQDHPSLKACEF